LPVKASQWKETMNTGQLRAPRVKLFAAIIGGSAVVAMGALTAAMHQEQTMGGPAPVNLSSGGMTLGSAVTTTTVEPTVLATAKAVPPVKAKPFGES
jgi:hypothetical protein